MTETKRINDIIEKQGKINGLVEITHELLDLFPEWDDVGKQPQCVSDYDIQHRQYDKQFDLSNEHKYLCVDSRDCHYKNEAGNRNYCQLHLEK